MKRFVRVPALAAAFGAGAAVLWAAQSLASQAPYYLRWHEFGVVVGELVGGNMGLGYLLSFGEGQANTAMVFVSIVMLTLVGGVAYLLVILIEQRVLHYLPRRTLSGV